MNDEDWMRLAIEKCREGIFAGQSPFGACIVRGDELIVAAHNVVWQTTDITAHAEVNAIRLACRKLDSIDLSGCRIYSTTEPCPMCFAACHWARLDKIFFGAGIPDANAYGFSELSISNEQMRKLGGSRIEVVGNLLGDDARKLFAEWKAKAARGAY